MACKVMSTLELGRGLIELAVAASECGVTQFVRTAGESVATTEVLNTICIDSEQEMIKISKVYNMK